MTLREEIEFIVDAYGHCMYPTKRKVLVNEIVAKIEKRIDSEINEIQKSIDSFTPECGYAMVNESYQKHSIKVLKQVKEMLK